MLASRGRSWSVRTSLKRFSKGLLYEMLLYIFLPVTGDGGDNCPLRLADDDDAVHTPGSVVVKVLAVAVVAGTVVHLLDKPMNLNLQPTCRVVFVFVAIVEDDRSVHSRTYLSTFSRFTPTTPLARPLFVATFPWL